MRPTRKNTLGQTPKLSHAPCDKPLSSQASLRVLFPESILGVFLLFVVVVMYKRIGMSNESILHTTSAALLPLLFKPFSISMAGRLHISHTATRLGFFLAFVFLLTMAHGIKNAASNIQYFSLFSLAISFCLISNTRPLCTVNAPAAATDAPWRKCAISYEIAILALMGGLVMFAGVLEVYTRQPRTSWAVSCVVMAIFLLSLSLNPEHHRCFGLLADLVFPHPTQGCYKAALLLPAFWLALPSGEKSFSVMAKRTPWPPCLCCSHLSMP